MAGSGAVLGGTGLIAGGIPGAKEPNSLDIWNLRGVGRSRVGLSNVAHNGRVVAPQPRSGILGFRANMHDAYIEENKNKTHGNAYQRGMRGGKLEAEQKIVRGMRLGRRATHSLTLGGAALTAAGMHRMSNRPVKKRETRQRGAVLGTSGAAVGGAAGAIAGLQGGIEGGAALVNRRIDREYPPHLPRPRGDLLVRQVKAYTRGGKLGALTGAGAVGTGGYRLARGKKVDKADQRRQDASAAAVGVGGTVAGIGHAVPKGLNRFSRSYSNSAKEHVLEAERLAPHFGGLKTLPPKVGAFGEVRRPAKETMYPANTDRELHASGAANRIKGGAKARAEVGRHRGIAAQERHFVEVFDNTGKVIRRVRGPGLALAGAGAAGLWASHQPRKVTKSVQYGYQERKRSLTRTAEFAGGVALTAYGASRLRMVGQLVGYGARIAEKQGAKPEQVERVMSAARALGRGTRQVTGRGEAQARKVKALNDAISAVPYGLRAPVATAAGVMLASNARPTTRETFTPVRF